MVPSALILVDVRHRPMSAPIDWAKFSNGLNAWKAWAKAKLEEVPYDLLPNLPSFIRRVCSGYALVWGVLRTQSV